jgi:hypothetical protein
MVLKHKIFLHLEGDNPMLLLIMNNEDSLKYQWRSISTSISQCNKRIKNTKRRLEI